MAPPTLTKEQRMKGAARSAEVRRAKAAAETAVSAQILEQLQILTEGFKDLKSRVDEMPGQTMVKPSDPYSDPVQAQRLNQTFKEVPKIGEATPGVEHTLPSWSHGGNAEQGRTQHLPQHVLQMNPPRFREGDRVHIKRDAYHGHVKKILTGRDYKGQPVYEAGDKLSWAETFDALGFVRCPSTVNGRSSCTGYVKVGEVCTGCGAGPEVLRVHFLSDDGHWYYQVRIPGFTNAQGMGLYDWELA